MTRSPHVKWPAAVALAMTAGVHAALVPEHLREAPYAGGLFIALSAAAAFTALLLVTRDTRRTWAIAGALSVLAMIAYVYSRSVGLPLMGDDVGDWLNPLGVIAVLSEAAAASISLRILTPSGRTRATAVRACRHGAAPGLARWTRTRAPSSRMPDRVSGV